MITFGTLFHVRGLNHDRLTRPPKQSLDGAPSGSSAPSGLFAGLIFLFLLFYLPGVAVAASGPAHGLWVWKSSGVLESPRGAETLLCGLRIMGNCFRRCCGSWTTRIVGIRIIWDGPGTLTGIRWPRLSNGVMLGIGALQLHRSFASLRMTDFSDGA